MKKSKKSILERKMNFDLENPYMEYESDDIPYSLYEIYGVSKIKELSRQLRTFLNYKTATIQYRFRPNNITCLDGEDKKYKETKKRFKTLASKFIKLLLKIRGSGVSFEAEVKKLLERVIHMEDKINKRLLVVLKDVSQKLFVTVHALSEQEIHLHPKLLKFIVRITQEMCIVFKSINHWASKFYEELRVNYLQLHDELSLLITEEKVEKCKIRKNKFLEEGVKEW